MGTAEDVNAATQVQDDADLASDDLESAAHDRPDPTEDQLRANEEADTEEDADLPRTRARVYPFKKNHPQSLTHCIRRRTAFLVPNTRRDPPPPAEEGDLPEVRDAWARWVLCQLASDRWEPDRDSDADDDAGAEPAMDAWTTLQSWLALETDPKHAPFVRLVSVPRTACACYDLPTLVCEMQLMCPFWCAGAGAYAAMGRLCEYARAGGTTQRRRKRSPERGGRSSGSTRPSRLSTRDV